MRFFPFRDVFEVALEYIKVYELDISSYGSADEALRPTKMMNQCKRQILLPPELYDHILRNDVMRDGLYLGTFHHGLSFRHISLPSGQSYGCLTVNAGNLTMITGNESIKLIRTVFVSRAPFQYPIRRLIVRSRKVSKPRDWRNKLTYRFAIWQSLRQQCSRCACQISERSDK